MRHCRPSEDERVRRCETTAPCAGACKAARASSPCSCRGADTGWPTVALTARTRHRRCRSGRLLRVARLIRVAAGRRPCLAPAHRGRRRQRTVTRYRAAPATGLHAIDGRVGELAPRREAASLGATSCVTALDAEPARRSAAAAASAPSEPALAVALRAVRSSRPPGYLGPSPAVRAYAADIGCAPVPPIPRARISKRRTSHSERFRRPEYPRVEHCSPGHIEHRSIS